MMQHGCGTDMTALPPIDGLHAGWHEFTRSGQRRMWAGIVSQLATGKAMRAEVSTAAVRLIVVSCLLAPGQSGLDMFHAGLNCTAWAQHLFWI